MVDFWQAVEQRWQTAAESIADAPASDLQVREMRWFDRRKLSGTIAVTGDRGAGKSTLRDGLLNRIGQNYTPPVKSLVAEPHRVTMKRDAEKERVSLIVVPGQASTDRSDALARLFDARLGYAPSGLIHVVCWGHNTVAPEERRTIRQATEAEGRQFDLDSVLHWNRQSELDEFRRVCEVVRGVWGRNPSMWLVIAVAQCHLYWNNLDAAADYYLPSRPIKQIRPVQSMRPARPIRRPRRIRATRPIRRIQRIRLSEPAPPRVESEFRQELRDLVEGMRDRGRTRVAILPVSSYPAAYRFDSRLLPVRPALTPGESRNLMGTFHATLGEFCDQREE